MDAGTAKQMQEAQPAIAEIYTHAAWALALAVADKGKDFSSRFRKSWWNKIEALNRTHPKIIHKQAARRSDS